jgi:hypothetical protein
MAPEELFDLISRDALQKFRRSSALLPPLKGVLITDEDYWRSKRPASLDG